MRPGPQCFFFQAEDGIRDFHVTGVQTCALPISQGAAKVYYVVSTKPLNYSADQIIKYGIKPNNSNIKAHGVIETSAGKEAKKTISALAQRSRYYAYFT